VGVAACRDGLSSMELDNLRLLSGVIRRCSVFLFQAVKLYRSEINACCMQRLDRGSVTHIFVVVVIYSVTLPLTKGLEGNWFPQLAPTDKTSFECENKRTRKHRWVSL
jgi:hypothetical protein